VTTPRGSILVIRGGAIGDFVLTLPVLAALRSQFPQARVEVLGYPHIAGLAVEGGLADAARPIEARSMAGFFARGGGLAPDMAAYFAGFDLIVSFLFDPDLIFQTNVARCTRARFIPGPHRPDDQAGVAAARVFLRPLESLAIFDASPVPALDFRSAPRSGGGPCLALLPGSGSEAKNWPESRWIELAAALADLEGWRFLVVGGEAEGGRLDRVAGALGPERAEVLRSRPLAELGGRLQACAAFVGHDSGISHLAAAVGLPGLVLWGPSVEAVWRPPAENIVLVRHPEGLEHLPLETVRREVHRLAAAAMARHQP